MPVTFATAAPGKPLLFGDIERALNGLLAKAGYDSQQYYAYPCGFALVTRVEQTSANWTPLLPPDRWAVTLARQEKWSLSAVIAQFARAPKGFYQIMVFLVTDQPISRSGTYPSLGFFDHTLKGGTDRLTASLRDKAVDKNVTCTVLIYEFIKDDGVDAVALDPGRLDAISHLRNAALLTGLGVH